MFNGYGDQVASLYTGMDLRQKLLKAVVFVLALWSEQHGSCGGSSAARCGPQSRRDAAARDRHLGVPVPDCDAGRHARPAGDHSGTWSSATGGCSGCSRFSMARSTCSPTSSSIISSRGRLSSQILSNGRSSRRAWPRLSCWSHSRSRQRRDGFDGSDDVGSSSTELHLHKRGCGGAPFSSGR